MASLLKRKLNAQVLGPVRPNPKTSAPEPAAKTLADQVYAQLREALMAGQFRPGQAITLRSVAEALDISHMPVRAALLRLEAEGAIAAPTNGRTLIIPQMRISELREIRDIRAELEGLAAERAAAIISNTEINVADQHCHLMQTAAAAGNLEAYIRENWAFHTAVYRASRMKQLLSMIERLWLRIGPHVGMMMPDRTAMVASMPNHHKVVEALRRRDGFAARAGIAADIHESAETLSEMLSE
ncbi:MAG TPA: GntR family transcriptional regulator [Rhizomicrobium sp.]|jgi:DNA-binding GntR family transcriptional regulator|nr:GntR family transcriptional regulator [Rhizomicrobium sp.]